MWKGLDSCLLQSNLGKARARRARPSSLVPCFQLPRGHLHVALLLPMKCPKLLTHLCTADLLFPFPSSLLFQRTWKTLWYYFYCDSIITTMTVITVLVIVLIVAVTVYRMLTMCPNCTKHLTHISSLPQTGIGGTLLPQGAGKESLRQQYVGIGLGLVWPQICFLSPTDHPVQFTHGTDGKIKDQVPEGSFELGAVPFQVSVIGCQGYGSRCRAGQYRLLVRNKVLGASGGRG